MNINKKLINVRRTIKLPKIEFNQMEGYNYRNAEAMLSAIKPVCENEGLTLWFEDDVRCIGVHNYVASTLTVLDTESGETLKTTAFAREDDVQTMPASPMITGSASSYAHKYALQNLFAIDDGTMDPDSFGGGNRPVIGHSPSIYDNPPEIGAPDISSVSMEQESQAPTAEPQMDEMTSPVQATTMQEPSTMGITPPQIDIPMPGQVNSFYGNEPVMGQAPTMPDVNESNMEESSFPWEQGLSMPYPRGPEQELSMPYPQIPKQGSSLDYHKGQERTFSSSHSESFSYGDEQSSSTFPVARQKEKYRLQVFGIGYETVLGRAKIMTDKGIAYYKTEDANSSKDPWSCESGFEVSLQDVDLNKLFDDASAKAGIPLSHYVGLIAP